MLLCLAIVAFIFFHVGSPQADEFGEVWNGNMKERRLPPNHNEFINKHNLCQNMNSWHCQKDCRLQFFKENESKCTSPSANLQCFGMPIRYNYTWNSIEKFPHKFELLKRFPTCWSLLGPLLCSTIYRPCSRNHFVEAGMNDTEKSVIETWQIFSNQLCNNAADACSFLFELDLWPKHLNCEKPVQLNNNNLTIASNLHHEHPLFSDKCLINEPLMIFPSQQCLWPLIKASSVLTKTQLALPLIDSCHLTCESPLAGYDWFLEDFRSKSSIITGSTGIVFLLITIYLWGFSKIYQTALTIFCLVHAFLCIGLYLIFWCISPYFLRTSALCVDNNRVRRFSYLTTFNLCAFEAIFSAFCLVAAYFWLISLFMLRIYRPTIRTDDNYLIYGSRPNEIDSRMCLVLIAYFIFPTILLFIRFLFWHDLPVDPLSGMCHVSAGSIEHSLIRHAAIGFFCFILIITFIWQMLKTWFQKNRYLDNRENVEDAAETLITDTATNPEVNEKTNGFHKYKEDEDNAPMYALEHGCGDGLFPDHWLSAAGIVLILTTAICALIQYTSLTDIGQKGEEEKILSSIKCSLNAMKHGHNPIWWNRTLNYDHLTSISNPYARKDLLFDSATAPNCDMPIITESQIFLLFISTIILPSLPFWIFGVSFFAGFHDRGIKSVWKRKNPFIRKTDGRHSNDGNEHELLEMKTIKGDIEDQTHITAFTAPAIMQTNPAYTSSLDGKAAPSETGLAAAAENVKAASVKSEPKGGIRKIDLNRRKLQHKKEIFRPTVPTLAAQYNSNMQQQPSSSKAIPPQQPQITLDDANYLNSLNSYYQSFQNLGTQSTLNMTSVSQQPPYHPPPIDMDLLRKVQAENNQLKNHSIISVQMITNLLQICYKNVYNFNAWSENFNQNALPQSRQMPPVNHAVPPIARIPAKPSSSVTSASSNGIANGTSTSKPKQLKNDPKVKIEHVKHVKATANGSRSEDFSVQHPLVVDDSTEDDEANRLPWHTSNIPPQIRQQWQRLKFEYNEDEANALSMTEEEIKENLLYRLIKHCGTFLPHWIYPKFRDNVVDYFDELYIENENRSEILSSKKIYPDTEAVEAAAERVLYVFLWPLICKSIRKTSVEMYLNLDAFTSERTEWIPNMEEFENFRTEMAMDDSSSSSSDESLDEYLYAEPNHHPPLDLQTLADVDEVTEDEGGNTS